MQTTTTRRSWRHPILILSLVLLPACAEDLLTDASPRNSGDPVLRSRIRVPAGFGIGLWADDVIRPRSMTLADDGTVFVGSYFFTAGVKSPVYALKDTDRDGRADRRWEIHNDFGSPNGVAYHDGTLFISDEDKVYRVDDVLENPGRAVPRLISSELPSRAEADRATRVGHFWRYLAHGPDDKVYVAVGTRWSFLVGAHAARDLDDPAIYSTIVRMNPDGSDLEIFADGVRNSMGMDFHPGTDELWFTDNGASWPFQDPRFYDIPPDELNRATKQGEHFGFPYVHGRLPDPLIGASAPARTEPPRFEFEAHTAPLGMKFYTGQQFPERYRGAIFVAEHGTEPTTPARTDQVDGDRISVIFLDGEGRVTGYEVFAEGFVKVSNAEYTRRPVDLLVMDDGSLLVSDDQAQEIYRIWYEGDEGR